jgi:hypothetical protein
MDRAMSRTLAGIGCALLFAACTAPDDPVVIEAESLEAGRQWVSTNDSAFSNHRAIATTAANAIASANVPELRKHRTWRAEVVVLHTEGTTQNVFELSVGGVKKQLTFGDPSLAAGLVRLDDLYFTSLTDDTVRVRSVDVGQRSLVVDRIRLFPEEIEAPNMITRWEETPARIQGEPCFRCVEAESLAPIDHGPNYGAASGTGWASYAEGSYSGGRAAITRSPGAVATGRIPRFRPAAAYRVHVAVTSQSAEKNAIDLQVGTRTRRITFGGATGIVLLKNIVFEDVSTNILALRAASVGQSYLIVDAISLEPLTDVPPPTREPWTAVDAEPIHSVCLTCVEAEAMAGVSTDPNYGYASGAGWAFYEQATYSGKRAALTRLPGAVMQTSIPNFRAGAYEVTVTVLNQDANENAFTITAGNHTETIVFGGKLAGGLLRLPPVRFDSVTHPGIAITATRIGQSFLIVDRLDVRPIDR